MQKHSKFARLSDEDKARIIDQLDRWGRGEIEQKLTWKALEDRSGFSRQSLSSHDDIKHAKLAAEIALKNLPNAKQATAEEVQRLKNQVEALQQQVADHERRERLWRERWQRIAFNVRQKGMQMHQIDAPTEGDLPSDRDAAKILRMFDKEIPPSKSHRGRK